MTDVPRAVAALRSAERRSHLFTLAIPAEAPPTRPYFARASAEEGRFTLMDSSLAGRAATPPPVTASADLEIAGVPVTRRVPVIRREAHLPFGYELYPLEILPPVSVSLQPRSRMLVRGSGDAGVNRGDRHEPCDGTRRGLRRARSPRRVDVVS